MSEKDRLYPIEKDRYPIRGTITVVLGEMSQGGLGVYAVEHNDHEGSYGEHIAGTKPTREGEMGLLSETYDQVGERPEDAFHRCLIEELGLDAESADEVAGELEDLGHYLHWFHAHPSGLADYFARPNSVGDVRVLFDRSGMLPRGDIGTAEVMSADFVPLDFLLNPETLIRNSYDLRLILRQKEFRDILCEHNIELDLSERQPELSRALETSEPQPVANDLHET